MTHGKVTVHSTHEAAGKIAGIGAVLYEGLLLLDRYHKHAGTTILAGAYEFREPAGRLSRWGTSGSLLYDSQQWRTGPPAQSELLCKPADTFSKLDALVAEWGGRIAYGERHFVTELGEERWIGIVVASPHGLREDRIRRFTIDLARSGYFNLRWYERRFPAIHPESGPVLCDDERVFASGKPLSGGVEFHRGRAYYPEDVVRPYKCNPFLVETEFYVHAAPLLWAATRTVTLGLTEPPRCAGVPDVFIVHDWLGVPLWWAMRMAAPDIGCRSVYMAHECRIARLLVEGALLDKRAALLSAGYDLRGHDVGFYPFMQDASRDGVSLDVAFANVAAVPGRPFQEIPFHSINREADRFGRVFAVGKWVRDETAWMLPNLGSRLTMAPNGIPTLPALRNHLPRISKKSPQDAAQSIKSVVDDATRKLRVALAKWFSQEADRRTKASEPDVEKFQSFAGGLEEGQIEIWTSVSRTETSKGPWRLAGLLHEYVRAHPGRRVVMLWLASPYPDVPSPADTQRWRSAFGWPFAHSSRAPGGDLLDRDCPHYGRIERFNLLHFWQPSGPEALIVFINQFGWSGRALGFGPDAPADDLFGAKFEEMRIGSDVELGLSVYEPFGLAPLEPFFSGKVCVLSDAFGCAELLQRTGGAGLNNLVLADYIAHGGLHGRVDSAARARIEDAVARQCAKSVRNALLVDRLARIEGALPLDDALSWDAVFRDYFEGQL
ncbi:MAG: hypothetical protein AB1714_00620 [Acidobacteriota bacterium]